MKHSIVVLASGLLTLALPTGTNAPLAAEKSQAVSIAVVDAPSLMQNSEAAKKARAEIEKARAQLQQKAKGEEETLEKLRQSIAQQRATLSAEAYEQLLRGLRQKISAYEIDMQERQDKLNNGLVDASNKVARAIVQIVDEIAKERNFAAVLSRAAVVSTAVDITPEALKRLNQRIPSVTIDLSK